MDRPHIHFIDWMKALGMFLIVFGHVAGDSIVHLTPPIYPKQLGVAFFIFTIGWGLARESRDRFQVVYNRLFPVFLLGLGFAMVMSVVVFVTQRDLNESNYLPFFLGINVLLDHFPANPTTWYIGTYIHLLLLWALVLHKVRVRLWMVGLAAVGEIIFRAAMLDTGALFRTYMVLPNWATVFLLGMYMRDREHEAKHATLPVYVLGLTILLITWTFGMRQVALDEAFPFRNFVGMAGPAVVLTRSACVTFLYVAYTWLVFEVTTRLPGYAIVAFFARHTLLIFIAHMPPLFALQPPLRNMIPSYWPRIGLLMLILYPGLALVSEAVMRLLQPAKLRDALWTLLSQRPISLSTMKRLVRWLPAGWQHRLSLLYYRYSIRRELEPAEFAVIRPLLDGGATIVDAGANLGIYSACLARHAGPDAEVVSIEPIPATYDILRSNLASLKIRNVRTLRCALSDQHRRVVMEVPSDEHGREVHYLARIKFTDQGKPMPLTHEVEAHPLDDVLRGAGHRVCFIKYDVEMHELEAITGSLEIIRRDHPAIYVEIQPDLRYKRSQRDDIVALLGREGYLPYWYDGDALRAFEAGGRVLDYFFLTSFHCRRLADAGVRIIGPDIGASLVEASATSRPFPPDTLRMASGRQHGRSCKLADVSPRDENSDERTLI